MDSSSDSGSSFSDDSGASECDHLYIRESKEVRRTLADPIIQLCLSALLNARQYIPSQQTASEQQVTVAIEARRHWLKFVADKKKTLKPQTQATELS